ncbi:DDE-type integrase/transposase/recombinase, partial [Streptococcus salivarius]
MKILDIHAFIRKKRKKYKTAKSEETAENKLSRNFYTTAPNKKWVTDVTEFKIPNSHKKLYLSAILDLYDRYPIAFVISGRNDNRLVFKTFDKAIEKNP